MTQEYLKFKKGDVIAQQKPSGSWSVTKIIEIDRYPNGIPATAHCLCYREVDRKPDANSISSLQNYFSGPIQASSFNDGYELVVNADISAAEFEVFTYHLKLTDFERYLQVTEQDIEEVVERANEHYKAAYYLNEQGKKDEAISEYSMTIDLFPYFFEALDNRAFIYMELGDYGRALSDFEESLRIEPDGFTAFFSKGECSIQLGDFAAAESICTQGLTQFPDRAEYFAQMLQIARSTGEKPSS